MSRIKIDGNNKTPYGVGNRISFSLVSSPKEGRKHILGFQVCRDYINDCLISFFNADGAIKGYWQKTDPPIDTTRLRLVIAKEPSGKETEESLKKKIYAAKRIINMYEDLAGFEKKSTIARAEHSTPSIKNCWLLTGPGEWVKSSHLISLITLTFRIVVESGGFEDLKTLEEVEARFKELISKDKSEYGDCGLYLPALFPKLRMLLECYDKLFRERPFTFWYPASKVGSWHSSGGIYCLCSSNTGVSDIKKVMDDMYEIWKKEKNVG